MSYFNEEVYKIPQLKSKNAIAFLSGKNIYGDPINNIPINDEHLLVIGSPGMGKTVQIKKIMNQTVKDQDSTHIIFDPKGEFCREFYREGTDHVISLFDVPGIRSNVRWNLMLDASNDPHPETSIREIVKAICKEAVKKSQNPFFPKSAESLITAVWIMVYRRYKDHLPNNDVLIQKTRCWTREQLLCEASRNVNGVKINADLYPIIDELTNPNGGVTTANIRQEMESILCEVFNPEGNFCSKGDFSVINFVRNSKGKRLFLVYDFATAESSQQIFGVLVNLMMKESLSVNVSRDSQKRIYYYLDELPVLPDNLTHLIPLCCFGRSAGNRVIAGIQGLSQLYDTYGEYKGDSLLAACTDNIIMKANDPITIEKMSRRSGQKNVMRTRTGACRSNINTQLEQTYNIPENILADLDVGQAIISLRGIKPFYAELDE